MRRKLENLSPYYLKNEGYEVLQAGDGGEGLEIVRKRDVYLIVLRYYDAADEMVIDAAVMNT